MLCCLCAGGDVPLALGMVVEMNSGLHRAIRFCVRFRAAVFERLPLFSQDNLFSLEPLRKFETC